MKKTIVLILTLLCFFTMLSFSYQVVATADYYATTVGLDGDELLNELALISQKNHKKYTTYADMRQMNAISDQDPSDSSKLLDFYSGISVKAAWDNGTTWNREHVWPQSLSGGLYGESGAGADIHHIRPTISSINSSRSNRLFTEFEVVEVSYNEKYYNGTLVAYMNEDYWEPLDNVKGDIARILMYLYMHYSKEVDSNKSYSYAGNLNIQNVVYTKNGSDGAWDLLLSWNELDPVDTFEYNRHEYCVEQTSVRNPFIDNEDFANLIWGDTDIAGGERYQVSYNVDTDVVFNYEDKTKYSSGKLIKVPTVSPYLEGFVFDGWYTDINYSKKWDFATDAITNNIDLYAKFVPETFTNIFSGLCIKSQLVFDVLKEETTGGSTVETVNINKIIKGEGTLAKGDYNLKEYYEFDSSLFDIYYKHNNSSSNNAYINSSNGQIRLYPGGGNGSSIEFSAKDGVKITEVTCTVKEGVKPTITVSADGKSAKIHNTVSATSGSNNQSRITGFKVTYELETSGFSYSIKEGSLAINYILTLTEKEYFMLLTSDSELSVYINDLKQNYEIVKYGNEYRVICTINVDNNTFVCAPKFVYDGIELSLSGYSAKTLAEHYLEKLAMDTSVKEYKECLLDIIG